MAVFVIDASATLPWCFADEATAATNAVLTRLRTGDEAIVPAHWPLEGANALLIMGYADKTSAARAWGKSRSGRSQKTSAIASGCIRPATRKIG